jgi:hypothetical protein
VTGMAEMIEIRLMSDVKYNAPPGAKSGRICHCPVSGQSIASVCAVRE